MDMLRVKKDGIVDAGGKPVRLRGFGVGGWMNMENFINGYPGTEQTLRRFAADEIGDETAEYLFDRMLDHVLAEKDIAFMKKMGCSVVRLPLNYRHFESDARPFRYIEKGFERLEKAVGWCEKRRLHVILDLHAVQGWQDPDWHSDNPTRITMFWWHPHFQERFLSLWKEFAKRYRGNAAIAGYNLINEPVTGSPFGAYGFKYKTDWKAINAVYNQAVPEIRKIDPEHIIFLEGDNFSNLFSGLDPPPGDNIVYSNHLYMRPGFGPGKYPGEFMGERWDRKKFDEKFLAHEGYAYSKKHRVPLWVGEFGGAFNTGRGDIQYRRKAIYDQIDTFEAHRAHWTIWTYKDIGMMGVATVKPDSKYMKTVAPVIRLKSALATDIWMSNTGARKTKDMVHALADHFLKTILDIGLAEAQFKRFLEQVVLDNYIGMVLQPVWAKCFRGMSKKDIDGAMKSFALENCRMNADLVQVMSNHMGRPA